MKRKIYLIIFILIFNSFAGAQEKSREQKIEELRIISSQVEQTRAKLDELESRQDTIANEVLAVNLQDKAEAQRIGAEVTRLFPAGYFRNLIPKFDEGVSDYSIYSFDLSTNYYYSPKIEYKNNFLELGKTDNSFGFMTNLGGTLLETISEQNREFVALAKYKLPDNVENIQNEYSSDDITFKEKFQVISGNTYLIRAFNNIGSDGIYGLKIHRKDSDGSIVLFVKKIKDFSAFSEKQSDDVVRVGVQNNSQIPDYATQHFVINTLMQKGFYNVTVEATTTEVTIRGTVPKGKMADAIMIAQETAKRKINNQLTEER